MKVRYIFKPFSCVFLLEGKSKYHLIWETLDTKEATYMWNSSKEIKIIRSKMIEIEREISSIRTSGKTQYIEDKPDGFQRIYHDYSDQREGFLKWKRELESKLI